MVVTLQSATKLTQSRAVHSFVSPLAHLLRRLPLGIVEPREAILDIAVHCAPYLAGLESAREGALAVVRSEAQRCAVQGNQSRGAGGVDALAGALQPQLVAPTILHQRSV